MAISGSGTGSMSESVWLERPSGDVPWGFRLHGGRDFHAPLTVQKVRLLRRHFYAFIQFKH